VAGGGRRGGQLRPVGWRLRSWRMPPLHAVMPAVWPAPSTATPLPEYVRLPDAVPRR
jgi:hypothetical protein